MSAAAGFDPAPVRPSRMIAIWCPDWPVATAQVTAEATGTASHAHGAHAPAGGPSSPAGGWSAAEQALAVITANHVVACSHAARMAGVRRGMRRREAQSRCPDLVVMPRDELAEARVFEPVVAAIESVSPGVEISRPGLAAIGARGPTRYFGSETAVVRALSQRLSSDSGLDGIDVLIGIADGAFAAEHAARQGRVIPPGESAAFLADLPIEILEVPELVDLLRRLGIRNLGAFAALPAADVLSRFGPTGAWVHRQCSGLDARPVAGRVPAAENTVEVSFEPALDRVDSIAFSSRTTAEGFITGLLDHGLACTEFALMARTENGEETVRHWRQTSVLTAIDVLDRIRWQLEGWLNGRSTGAHPAAEGSRPTGGVSLLRLIPVQCVPTGAHQQSLWSSSGADDERAHRALARVQTLLGHGSVHTPLVSGGHNPASRTQAVVWGEERRPERRADAPWPGQLPAPLPSVLIDPPRAVRVLDAGGRAVTVTDRGAVPFAPARLDLSGGSGSGGSGGGGSGGKNTAEITAWAGPWPVDDSWWNVAADRSPLRRARFQLVDGRGRAYLVTCSFPVSADHPAPAQQWTLDAIYD